MAFHSKDGWWFERESHTGHVIVYRYSGPQDHDGFRIIFTPQEWASIVASVSREGENQVSWQAALERQMP